jgi:hypothetical protein
MAVAVSILVGWALRSNSSIKIDWSFLIPLGGAVGTIVPTAIAIVSWLDARLKECDSRLDQIEILAEANKSRAEHSERDRGELRKILLKLEARIESIRDNQVGVQLGELVEQNRQLLKKIDEREP